MLAVVVGLSDAMKIWMDLKFDFHTENMMFLMWYQGSAKDVIKLRGT